MDIKEIANMIKNEGGRLYLVGGAVRDSLLGKEVHDEDYCVVGIDSEKFKQLFKDAHTRGKSFEVYDIDGNEFAMARREMKSGIGHKEFEIEIGKHISIEEDLKRRDITINAMAKDVLTGEIIDPYNGKNDLEQRIIRATSEAFIEDPLRVYRVARFAAMLGFDVDKDTIKMMEKLKEELKTLSAERVFTEFKKALGANKPSIFFKVLREANVLGVHFKEIYDLIGSMQPIEHHPEGDSYNHTMIVLDNSAMLTDDIMIRFCALIHDLGKGTTPMHIRPHHYGHEDRGVKLVENLGKRLKIPNSWIKCGKVTAKEHMRGGIFNRMSIPKKVDFITRVDKSILGLDGMEIIVKCDRNRWGEFPKDIVFAKIGKEMIKIINGKYIKEKYNIIDEKIVGDLIRQERIKWYKENVEQ